MDGHQALNLSAKNQGRASQGGGGGGVPGSASIRHSASTSALSRQQQQQQTAAAQQPSPFDLLAAFGGDLNSAAVTALAAANSGLFTNSLSTRVIIFYTLLLHKKQSFKYLDNLLSGKLTHICKILLRETFFWFQVFMTFRSPSTS